MDYALESIIGKRENQEDFGVVKSLDSSGCLLAVISDGMGGRVAGEVASSTSVSAFVESFTNNTSKNLPLKLRIALDKANQNLAQKISINPRLQGMGATLVAVHIGPGSMNWISVGDSILYLHRDGKLLRLNEDHSMFPVLQESVRKGQITSDEARGHPHRNALRSALTGNEVPLIDHSDEPYSVINGDIVVLSTDGSLTLPDSEISSIIENNKNQPANVIVDRLLKAVTAANKPRQDNTLIEVIKVSGAKRSSLDFLKTFIMLVFIGVVVGAVLAFFGLGKISSELLGLNMAAKKEKVISQPEVVDIKPSPIPIEITEVTENRPAPQISGSEQIPPVVPPAQAPKDKKNQTGRHIEVGGRGSENSARVVVTTTKSPPPKAEANNLVVSETSAHIPVPDNKAVTSSKDDDALKAIAEKHTPNEITKSDIKE